MTKKYELKAWLGSEASYHRSLYAEEYALAHPQLQAEVTPFGDREDLGEEDSAGFSYYEDGEGLVISNGEGMAVLSVQGPMVAKESWWNSLFGEVSYPVISRAAMALANDPDISTVILHLDTNGGDVSGLESASEAVSLLGQAKQLHTFTNGGMLSAGMWLGVQGQTITATAMSELGSIGVLMVHTSYAKAMEEEGIRVTVFRAGSHKALATPYEDLSEEAIAEMNDKSAKLYGFFTTHIEGERASLNMANVNAWAEGRTFFGQEAVDIGLADGLGSLTDLVGALSHVDKAPVNTNNIGNLLKEEQAVMLFGNKKDKPPAPVTQVEQALLAEGVTVAPDSPADPKPPEDEGIPAGAEDEGEGTDAPATQGDGDHVETSAAAASTSALIALASDKAKLEMKVVELEAKLAESESTTSGLCSIASQAINRMEVGLGGTITELSGTSAAALVLKHTACREAFQAKFPVGRVTKEPEPDNTGDNNAFATGLRSGIIPHN